LCCGTGDLLLALEAGRGGPVMGQRLLHPMLTAAAGACADAGLRSQVFEQ
jgi:hypothetical protein